jgi:hypothetical protein
VGKLITRIKKENGTWHTIAIITVKDEKVIENKILKKEGIKDNQNGL